MKALKNSIATVALLIVSCIMIQAQEVNKEEMTIPLSNPGQPGKLDCGLVNGSIIVTGYNGNEVLVIASQPLQKVSIEEETSDDPSLAGMKKITTSSFSISAEENENVVEIDSDSYKSTINLEIKVPLNFDLDIGTVNNGDIVVENVDGSLEVTNVNGHITLTGVSGSVVTNTVNGEVKVSMNRIDADTPMSFASFNGNVDVTLPSSVKATTKMKSTSGDIYTDFDVEFETVKSKVDESNEEGVYKVSIDEYVAAKLNGGGPEFGFQTFSGDIYLRKK